MVTIKTKEKEKCLEQIKELEEVISSLEEQGYNCEYYKAGIEVMKNTESNISTHDFIKTSYGPVLKYEVAMDLQDKYVAYLKDLEKYKSELVMSEEQNKRLEELLSRADKEIQYDMDSKLLVDYTNQLTPYLRTVIKNTQIPSLAKIIYRVIKVEYSQNFTTEMLSRLNSSMFPIMKTKIFSVMTETECYQTIINEVERCLNEDLKKYNISADFKFEELAQFDFFKDFILVKGYVDEEYEKNEENTIYSIGPNGVNLLIDYFNIQVPRWEFKNISKSADKVIKALQVVDIYINIVESFKDFNIVYESVGPNQRRALGDKFDVDFEWSISGNINQNFLLLIIRDEDLKEGFNRKIFKLEHFLSEKGKWRYDYIDIPRRPKVIFVCENEESMKIISKKLRGSSLNKHTLLLYTHDILLKENLLTDCKTLKKYIKETNSLKEYKSLNENLILSTYDI